MFALHNKQKNELWNRIMYFWSLKLEKTILLMQLGDLMLATQLKTLKLKSSFWERIQDRKARRDGARPEETMKSSSTNNTKCYNQ
jgi:hypothetical protein